MHENNTCASTARTTSPTSGRKQKQAAAAVAVKAADTRARADAKAEAAARAAEKKGAEADTKRRQAAYNEDRTPADGPKCGTCFSARALVAKHGFDRRSGGGRVV